MNRAKATGRNRWVLFETEMVERAARAFAVENDLRRAFSADEFRVLFQPVVTIPERAVAGFEALVRWQHPVEGLLGPDRFLAVADDAGLMIPLGRWVLHDACRSLREWPVDRSLHVSVNLTLRQLLHRELVDDVARLLDQLMLPHSSLVLELGEGLLLADPEATAETLGRLAELGVRLCIDDFGSGWASLGLIHRVRFQMVKLDRSLLAGIGDDPERWGIVEQLHGLARHLGLEVVAQGIGDHAQLARLQSIGFTLGQSHLLGEPMESAAAARLAGG
jgi:EAL domain-containing protein (putative c-di-GMP-specific phosphodiesterase class I)